MTLEVRRDDATKTVDWWFMYKLPHGVKPSKGASADYKATTGWEYLYFDSESKGPLALSTQTLDGKSGALHGTLQQLYEATSDSKGSLGWICYNDEVPNTDRPDDRRKGHTKGVLAFDEASDTAFWLLHSWPKFPDIQTPGLGSDDYGQTYLCITLKDVETARFIAEQMYHRQEPQAYDCRLPASLAKDDCAWSNQSGLLSLFSKRDFPQVTRSVSV